MNAQIFQDKFAPRPIKVGVLHSELIIIGVKQEEHGPYSKKAKDNFKENDEAFY